MILEIQFFSSKMKSVFALMLTFLFSLSIFSQQVSGLITDESNVPMPGVNIIVKGTTVGVVSDFDGNYSISASSEDILVFSFVGFSNQEIQVGTNLSINVTMITDADLLEEVVVTGYGTTKRANLTSSVSKINAESIKDRNLTSLGEVLSGQLAGVYAQQRSGLPGAELEIKIRGVNSITSGSEPLYVIDGLPVEDMKDFNINDVQSIDVLKDASAAAIYGARGAGGVVLITTKQAKPGETRIDLDVYSGFQSIEASNKLPLMNAQEHIAFREWWGTERATVEGKTSELAKPMGQRNKKYRGPTFWYTNPELIAPGEGTDWQDEIMRSNALKTNYQVSVFKGIDDGNFMVSAGYMKHEGLVVNSDYNRFSFRANGNYSISDKISAGINMSATTSKQLGWREGERKEGAYMRALTMSPTIIPGTNHRNGVGLLDTDPDPVMQMMQIKDVGKTQRSLASANINYTPLEGLNIKGSFGFDNKNWRYDWFKPMNLNKKARREALLETTNNEKYLYQLVATYDKTIGNHEINLIAGTSFEETMFEYTSMDSWDFGSDDIQTFNAATGFRSWNDYEVETALQSYFGKVSYNFSNRYILNASVRRDGSSRFGADTKFGVFPAASFAWRISEETFMNIPEAINQLKVRISWGQAGNDRIGAYNSFGTLNGNNYPFGGSLNYGFGPNSASNPDLSWETTTSQTLGIDFGLFGNRIYGSIDIYNNLTSDLLLDVSLPAVSGLTQEAVLNTGEVSNKGYEIELNSTNINKNDFKWATSFNLSHNKNKVESLGYGLTQIIGYQRNIATNITRIGYPIASYYMYKTNGLVNDSTPVKAANQVNGNQAIVDVNGDGKISGDDRTILGDNSPKYVYGIRNSFSYKNWDMSILVNGIADLKTYFFFGRYIDNGQSRRNLVKTWSDNVTGASRDASIAKTSVNLPLKPAFYPFGAPLSTFSDRWLMDGDYLRVKNITVGYTVPNTDAFGVSSMRVYLTADNMFNFTDYPGGNPETNVYNQSDPLTQGSDYATYPLSRTFSIGMKASF